MADVVLAGFLALLAVGVYFTPAAIAFARHLPNAVLILLINWLAGWSVAGWAVAFSMSLRRVPRPGPAPVQVVLLHPAADMRSPLAWNGLAPPARHPDDAPPWQALPPRR